MPEPVLEDPKLENREGAPQLSVRPQRKVLGAWTPQCEVHVETMGPWPGRGHLELEISTDARLTTYLH